MYTSGSSFDVQYNINFKTSHTLLLITLLYTTKRASGVFNFKPGTFDYYFYLRSLYAFKFVNDS